MSRWWRAYDEALNDPKLQKLSGDLFKSWFNLLCLASKNEGQLPPMDDVAFALRTTTVKAAGIVTELVVRKLFDRDGNHFIPHNWESRQFKSDVSNDRVQRFRERQRNAECNVTETVNETPPEAEQTQIPDSEKKKENSRTKGPTAYPDDFKIWWKSYPTTPIMSKKQAFVEWQRLSPEDRLAAFAALPGYKEFLRKNPTHAVVHGCRFLSQRRFDGFEDAAAERAPIVLGFHADEGSAELDAWDAYSRATKGKNCPRDRAGGWTVPSQWPPKIEAVA